MLHDYYDIRKRIDAEPKWWDENGVPRYDEFCPGDIANIYAEECALVLITCQNCVHEFKVAFSQSSLSRITGCERQLLRELEERLPRTKEEFKAIEKEVFEREWKRTLADSIREKSLHYGDPPNVDCCGAGATMNSEPRRVLEYWRRYDRNGTDIILEWHRDRSLEIALEPDWVTEGQAHEKR